MTFKDYLSIGIVVLISIAIALGIVFFLVVIGLFFVLRRRSTEQQRQYPVNVPYTADQSEKTKHRPTSLLATLNAATAMIATESSRNTARNLNPDDSASLDNEVAGIIRSKGPNQEDADEDEYVRARWSFE